MNILNVIGDYFFPQQYVNYLSTLPRGPLWTIAKDFDVEELTSLCSVNKELYNKLCNNNEFWKFKVGNDFPNTAIPEEVIRECNGNWKCIYDLLDTNDLYMFGDNDYGQLGLGDSNLRRKPKFTANNVREIVCGYVHTAYITINNELYMFGNNSHGQLGTGDLARQLFPVKVMDGVYKVALGRYHTAVISLKNELYTFGGNEFGQLGKDFEIDEWSQITPRLYDQAVRVNPQKIIDGVKEVACGEYSTYYIDSKGYVYSFGENDKGQLGLGYRNYGEFTPKYVKIVDREGYTVRDIIKIEAGFNNVAVIDRNFNCYRFGYFRNKRSNSPTFYRRRIKKISLNDTFIAFIDLDGELFIEKFTTKKMLENMKYVSVGEGHIAAIDKQNRLYTWGLNNSGQLGHRREKELRPYFENISKVSAGKDFTGIISKNSKFTI